MSMVTGLHLFSIHETDSIIFKLYLTFVQFFSDYDGDDVDFHQLQCTWPGPALNP